MSTGKNDLSWDFTLEQRCVAVILLKEYVSSFEITYVANLCLYLIVQEAERKRETLDSNQCCLMGTLKLL